MRTLVLTRLHYRSPSSKYVCIIYTYIASVSVHIIMFVIDLQLIVPATTEGGAAPFVELETLGEKKMIDLRRTPSRKVHWAHERNFCKALRKRAIYPY